MCLTPDGGGSGGMPSGLRPKTILGDGGSAPVPCAAGHFSEAGAAACRRIVCY